MNRHERRKQKKINSSVSNLQNELLRAIQLHTKRDFENAETLYKQIILKEPNNYDALRHLGILKQDLGNYEEAYENYLKCIKVKPNGFEALNNLGAVHVRNKNYQLALKCFGRAYEINENYVPTINNLASLYHKLNYPSKALEMSSKAIKLQPNNLITLNQYAKALIISNDLKEAIKILERYHKTFPDHEDFALNLSTAYKEIGEFEKSNKIINAQFKRDYKNLQYLLGYSHIKNNKLSKEHIDYYEDQIEKGNFMEDDKVVVCHAFFRNFSNQGMYDEAGKYLIRGNDIQYKIKPFNLEKEKQAYEKIKSLFLNPRSIKFKKTDKPKPIFVCGMPRSGTTLCEQILSSHSKVDGAGELSYLAEMSGINAIISPEDIDLEKFEEVVNNKQITIKTRNDYLDALESHGGKNAEYICDKMPHNFVLIGLIKLLFPEAKIIYCKRAPIDNCFSLYSHKFTELSHQYSYNQKMLAQYYKLHVTLVDFWIDKFKDSIFVLDNEELVENQEKVSKQLIEFCELEWEDQCLEFYKNKRQVRTASIEQVRQPMNKKSIGAWKKYEKYFEDLVTELDTK